MVRRHTCSDRGGTSSRPAREEAHHARSRSFTLTPQRCNMENPGQGGGTHLDDSFDDDFGAREREQALVDADLRYGLRRAARGETGDEVLHCARNAEGGGSAKAKPPREGRERASKTRLRTYWWYRMAVLARPREPFPSRLVAFRECRSGGGARSDRQKSARVHGVGPRSQRYGSVPFCRRRARAMNSRRRARPRERGGKTHGHLFFSFPGGGGTTPRRHGSTACAPSSTCSTATTSNACTAAPAPASSSRRH